MKAQLRLREFLLSFAVVLCASAFAAPHGQLGEENARLGGAAGAPGSTKSAATDAAFGDGYRPSGGAEVLASLTVTKPTERIDPGMENNIDRPGADYDRFHINDYRPDRCKSECERDRGRCRAWTYVRPGIQHKFAVCYLKTAIPAPAANNCCISGVSNPPAPPPNVPGAAARCKPGFVWRVARPTDYVCVTPDSRALVAQENSVATTRWDPNGAYGPYTCIAGYVWREAFDGDVVCVSPERRSEVKEENRLAPQRREWAPQRPM